MADQNVAIDHTLKQEDSQLTGKVTDIPGDAGGLTRYGLTAKYHPQLVAAGFFEAPAADALVTAREEYAREYTGPLLVPYLKSQAIANALVSFAVNEEPAGDRGRAVRLLQEAAASRSAVITVDGEMGPQTVTAINSVDPANLLKDYCERQGAYYRMLVAENPSQEKFLHGWLNRVAANAAG